MLDFSEAELDHVRKIDAEDGDDVVIGSSGRDVIEGDDGDDTIDGGAGSDKIYAGRDDDIGIYRAEENEGSRDYYDGGRGTDTLRLVVTEEQYNSAEFQADLARYQEFLDDNSRPWSKYGRCFEFETMDLKVRNWEQVEVVVEDGEPGENSPPVAEDDVFTATEGNTMTGDVMANDHDPDSDGLEVTQVNGSDANVGTQMTLDSGAQLTVQDDGTFAYSTNGAFEHLGDGETFTETFTYEVSDGQGGSATATATITVHGMNDGPDAVADTATTDEAGSVAIDVLANDSDVDVNDTLSVASLDTTGTVGSVAIVNGQVVYDPNGQFESLGAGESTTDSFSYTVSDGNGGTATATVTVTINGVNDGPTAADDTAGTSQDNAVVIDVLANDSDPDANDVLSVTSASASNGSVVINGDGTLTYTPDAGFSGSDSISYTIDDGNGGTASATVDVTVSDTNDMPQAQDDTIAANEGNTRIGNVLSNDSDPDGDPLSVTEVNGSAANVGVQMQLASGAFLTVEADGDVIFVTNGAYNHLSVGDSASETFTYTVSDGNGGTSTATATITIAGANDAPEAGDDAVATGEGASVAISVLANDSDVDQNDSVSISSVDATGLQGGVSVVGDQIVYDPSGQFEHLGAGQTATETFSYTIDDGNGGTATASVTVTINGENDGPAAGDDVLVTSEDNTATLSVLGNDSDLDADDVLTVTQVNGNAVTVGVPVTLASGAEVTLNADGTFGYNPNQQFESLGAGQSAPDSFSYTIDDGNGGTATATVSVTVNGANDAPVAGDDSVVTDEASSVTISVLGNDSDADAGDNPTITQVNGNAVTVGVPVALASGALVTLNADGTFGYDPNGQFENLSAGRSAPDSFEYTVEDGNGGVSTATVSVTVNGVNDDPTAAADTASTDEGSSVSISVLGNDGDTDDDDSLSVASVDATGLQGGVSIAGNQVVYDPSGQFEHLGAGETATETFSYTVSDGNGGTASASVTVTVNGINDGPAAGDDAASTDEDSAVNVAVLGNDSDVDTNDVLTVTEVNGAAITVGVPVALASGALVTLNADGTFSYDPNGQFESLGTGQSGVDSFTYTIDDGNGGTATATVDMTIDGVNDAPVATADLATTEEGNAVTTNVLANDNDVEGNSLSVTGISSASNGSVVLNPDNTITYTPNAGFSGSDTYSYTVSDGQGGSHTASVTVTVTPAPQPVNGPTLINVGTLDGSNGFIIAADQQFDSGGFGNMGRAVSSAGDVNGDGFADFIVSDPDAELSTFQPGFPASGGVAYLVFGSAGGFPTDFDIRTEPSDGNAIQLYGAQTNGNAGASVGGGGDIDGDGFSDLIIGEPGAGAGRAFVVYGGPKLSAEEVGTDFTPNVELEFLDASNARAGFPRKDVDGLEIIGEASGDELGAAVANAGDFDGDGLADIVLGAPGADGGAGAAYIIYDPSDALNGELRLADLEANQGLKVTGFSAGAEGGFSVAGAGDVNGDGLDDVIVGARSGSQAFVIFGSAAYVGAAGQAAATVDVSTLDGSNGFALLGGFGDMAGISVSMVGDVDGDGYDDMLIGARLADGNGGATEGQAYVVYGGSGGFAASIDLQALDGTNGFAINGINAGDRAGNSVSAAGDINGDGLADFIVGAERADPHGVSSGEAYVVYGQAGRSFSSFDLADLKDVGAGGANEGGQLGFVIEGATSSDRIGSSVSAAGDINGDGFDDLVVGGYNAGTTLNGESYVIFGGNFTGAVTHAGTSGADSLTGGAAADNMLGGAGDDTLTGGAGDDRMVGGSGNDVYVFSDDDGADILEDFELYDSATGRGDRIDLSQVSGVQSFADLNIQDVGGDGNADILLGNGNSITLIGVNGSALDADDFLF